MSAPRPSIALPRRALSLVAAGVLALSAVVPVEAASLPPLVSWATSTAAATGSGAVIAATKSGALRVAYEDSAGLWFARRTSTGWSRVQIAAVNAAEPVSMRLDGRGKAHVAYRVEGTPGIWYATDRFGSWRRFHVSNDDSDAWHDLAVDADGEVVVAFARRLDPTKATARTALMQATNRRGHWQVDQLTRPPSGGWDGEPAVALDAQGALHVAFRRRYPDSVGIRYLTNASGTWATRTVTTYADDHLSRVAIGPSGHAFVTFVGELPWPGGIGVSTNRSGTWVTKRNAFSTIRSDSATIAPTAAPGLDLPDIAVDASDRLHIVSSGMWATDASGAWVVEPFTPGNTGRFSMVLGPLALPTIAMSASTGWGGPVRIVEPVASWSRTTLGTDSSYDVSVAADGAGRLHVAWMASGTSHGIRYATNASGSWVLKWLSTDPYVQQPTIAVDSAGKAHVAYWVGDPATDGSTSLGVRYRTNASGSWTTEVVTTGNDTLPLISIGPDDTPWISVIPGGIVHRTTGGWTPVSVPASISAFPRHAFAVDASGRLHLAGLRWSPTAAIVYATNSSGSWISRTFSGVASSSPVLRLDASDRAHLAYQSGADVKYATNATGSWVTRTIARSGWSAAWRPGLALEPDGDPWIATATAEELLVVARRAGTAWSTETLPAGHPSALAMAIAAAGPAVVAADPGPPVVLQR